MKRAEACLLCLGLALTTAPLAAATRTSSSYAIETEVENAAGQRTSSVQYRIDGSVGGIGGVSSVVSPNETAKHGYIGQLYEIVGLKVAAPSANLNETASGQLTAAPLLDDATTLAALNPSTVTWSILSGPVASISSSGLATAATVYQDTPASLGGLTGALSGQLALMILNIGNDDFGSYASDGIDDSWQVQYFGLNNPSAAPAADPDGDGQNNLFEYTAGLVPTNSSSLFRLSTASVPGQPSRKTLTFSPIVAGRTHTPSGSPTLVPSNWTALTGYTQSDNGTTRTVTDQNATGPNKFYRVQISKP